MYIVTTDQMATAEQNADATGLSYTQMMENAGHAVAYAIKAYTHLEGTRVLILVGPGNNGGDGLVAARYLDQLGAFVSIYVWKRDTENDPNWTVLDNTNVERLTSHDAERLGELLAEVSIIVDALLGTGVSRPIEGDLADLLDRVRLAGTSPEFINPLTDPLGPNPATFTKPLVVAVDVPTGLNSDTGAVDPYTVPASLTVSFAAAKRGHVLQPGSEVVGHLLVADIEIEDEHYPDDVALELVTADDVLEILPERPANAHKGTFGTATLVAGSKNYTGAAALTALGAARSGAGLVTLVVPAAIHPILAARLIDITYLPLPDAEGSLSATGLPLLLKTIGQSNALLVGPGLGQHSATADFLKQLLRESLPPLVVDADGLNLLAQLSNWWGLLPVNTILTPHPGEMARLTQSSIDDVQANRLEIALQKAAKWQHVVLLKGAHTIITAPDGRQVVLPFANPALAKAGSGDVLAGVITGLLAQGLDPFEAAVAGGYLHGLAGELARETMGTAPIMAEDLAHFLADAVHLMETYK